MSGTQLISTHTCCSYAAWTNVLYKPVTTWLQKPGQSLCVSHRHTCHSLQLDTVHGIHLYHLSVISTVITHCILATRVFVVTLIKVEPTLQCSTYQTLAIDIATLAYNYIKKFIWTVFTRIQWQSPPSWKIKSRGKNLNIL